jgi:hypothetical protein
LTAKIAWITENGDGNFEREKELEILAAIRRKKHKLGTADGD